MSEGSDPPVLGWPAESAQRLEKARALRALGIDPYPNRFTRSSSFLEILAAFGEKSLEELEALAADVTIAGRVMTKRGHGKASFATLSDGGASLQIYVRLDSVGEAGYRVFDLVDQGDFLGVVGRVMRTRKGELSVQAKELVFLSKALLPPPEKWHGLADTEARYRQRYVDLFANPEVRRTFIARSAMVAEIRRFLDARGYVEVETPMMQPVPGGALARPFRTHHNALGIDLYLRIAPELYLKRLVVGGLERVYEINRNFRNEGIDSQHNPEFTMLEFYTAYFDCRDVIDLTEGLIAQAAQRILGSGALSFKGEALSLEAPFRRIPMAEAVHRALTSGEGAIEVSSPRAILDKNELAELVASPGFAALCKGRLGRPEAAGLYASLSHGRRIAQLFEDFVEGQLFQPTFITDYPLEISPLAKRKADDPSLADRFELFIAGMEVANGFSELNDPADQERRFQAQVDKGGTEAPKEVDVDYIRALAHGLPPTAGEGIGIDRLIMLLTNSRAIREVILFPLLRPRAATEPDEAKNEAAESGSAK